MAHDRPLKRIFIQFIQCIALALNQQPEEIPAHRFLHKKTFHKQEETLHFQGSEYHTIKHDLRCL